MCARTHALLVRGELEHFVHFAMVRAAFRSGGLWVEWDAYVRFAYFVWLPSVVQFGAYSACCLVEVSLRGSVYRAQAVGLVFWNHVSG